jgi:hypothetical protein
MSGEQSETFVETASRAELKARMDEIYQANVKAGEELQASAAALGLSMNDFEGLILYLKMDHEYPVPRNLVMALLEAINGVRENAKQLTLSFVTPAQKVALERQNKRELKLMEREFEVRRAFVLAGGLNRNGYDNAIYDASLVAKVKRTSITRIMTKDRCAILRAELEQCLKNGMPLADAHNEIAPPWSSVLNFMKSQHMLENTQFWIENWKDATELAKKYQTTDEE